MINRLIHKIYLQTALSLARDVQAEQGVDPVRLGWWMDAASR